MQPPEHKKDQRDPRHQGMESGFKENGSILRVKSVKLTPDSLGTFFPFAAPLLISWFGWAGSVACRVAAPAMA